jgi:hypothetical protein
MATPSGCYLASQPLPMSLKLLYSLLLALLAGQVRAQTPAPVPRWATASVHAINSPRTYPWPHAVVVDEDGNIFTAGMFNDTVTFGSHRLVSAGQGDFYVAKYVPATGTWAWAVRGGGVESDVAHGLAVRKGCVYITGYLRNNSLDDSQVTLDSTQPVSQPGAVNAQPSSDLFVAKYIDCGAQAVLAWCQVAGGAEMDYGTGIAVSGSSVYVTGTFSNDSHNTQGVVFGTRGPLLGMGPPPTQWPQLGTSPTFSNDLVLAKYSDYGFSATFDWSQVAGGNYAAVGRAIAVQGNSVYVAGELQNAYPGSAYVRLGGHGRVLGTAHPLGISAGAGSYLFQSWLLVKYTDLGDHAAVGWSQVAGSHRGGTATNVAVSGHSVYVLGAMGSDTTHVMRIHLSGGRTRALSCPARSFSSSARRASGPTQDAAVLAKYTDHGPTSSFEWLRLDGTSDYYEGSSLVAQGPWVYTMAYSFFNRTHTRQGIRGGTRRPRGGAYRGEAPYDVKNRPYIAGYYDEGPRATLRWVRVFDYAFQMQSRYFWLGLHGPRLYVVGNTWLPVPFGRFTLTSPGQDFGFVVAGLDLTPTLDIETKDKKVEQLLALPKSE